MGGFSLEINAQGQIYEIRRDRVQINAYKATSLFPGPFELYLRDKTHHEAYPLFLGAEHLTRFDNGFLYDGSALGINYYLSVILLDDFSYCFRLALVGEKEGLDLLFVHDIGLADQGAVSGNELYVSQYVDHHIANNEWGYVILSRQNQGKPHPGLAVGSVGLKSVHYATDLSQFYGSMSKITGEPALLFEDLPDVNKQYELGAAILQSESFDLKGKKEAFFYGLYSLDEPEAYTHAPFHRFLESVKLSKLEGEPTPLAPCRMKKGKILPLLETQDFTPEELSSLYPERLQEEKKNDVLYSFFLPSGEHVASKAKEALLERNEGNILYRHPKEVAFAEDSFTSTGYAYGVFMAQTVLGNTSLHKLTPVNRGLLDVPHNLGMRILIKKDGSYRLLGVPSLFEMGFSYNKWIYKLKDDVVVVSVTMAHDKNELELSFHSKTAYKTIVLFEAVLGEGERLIPFARDEKEDGRFVYSFAEGTYFHDHYPELHYDLRFSSKCKAGGDGYFYEDGQNRLSSLQFFHLQSSDFTLDLGASLTAESVALESLDPSLEEAYARGAIKKQLAAFRLSCPKDKDFAEKTNLILPWFASGALIHYLVPHGLEQSGGAAWGTRDVSQGPYELFSSTGHFEECRPLILDVYSHEIEKSGEWPQWFMLDKYAFAADDCHGDIVFWPLRILADYLKKSGDSAILNAVLPFQDSLEKSTLEKHMSLSLEAVERRFIPGTDFISYGGGDWDDTLQPADPTMKSRLVSPWTQELAYQTLKELASVLPAGHAKEECLLLSARLKKGYDEHFLDHGEIPGFLYVKEDGTLNRLVTSKDETTGIHYRLLPYTRAIISGLASKEDAHAFSQLISEKLAFPDGVRLMDRPAHYDGGVNHLFVRAEEASNVGREISLCYIHADIRYAESMCRLGDGVKALDALKKINPINLDAIVKNAAPRQSNAYFSSSDPDFNDRYDFAKGIEKLRKGEVKVRGGWRVYSSGNGIYIARLIGDLFGLKPEKNALLIDPVLAPSLDESVVDVDFGYGLYHFHYHLGSKGYGVKAILLDGNELKLNRLENPYREGGVVYPLTEKNAHDFDVYTF